MTTVVDSCPTPTKSRYATKEAAEAAAVRNQVGVGMILHAYQCDPACNWWHLTSKPRITATPEDMAEVHALTDEQFRHLVLLDAQYRAPRVRSLALRDPSLIRRWISELRAIERDLNRKHNGNHGAKELREALTARRTEAQQLVEQRGVCVPVPARAEGEAALRAAAGKLAIDRLIAAHRAEFTQLLLEEYTRLGVSVPDRIRRRQLEHGIPDPEPPS